MIIQLNWTNFKACVDANPTINLFYSTEDEFKSNKPAVPDITRYFIRQTLGNDENHCFICKDAGTDQEDFDDNYKTLSRTIKAL